MVKIWNATTGELRDVIPYEMASENRRSFALAVSPDDARLLVVTCPHYKKSATVHAYKIDDGTEIWSNELHAQFGMALAVSPDGKFLAIGCRNQLFILDATNGSVIADDVVQDPIACVDFAPPPNGKQLACAVGRRILLYEVPGFDKIKMPPMQDDAVIWSLAFLPNGNQLITGGDDGRLKLWDLTTHKVKRTTKRVPDFIQSVDVSPDGKRFISGCKDGNVYLWHSEVGELLLTLRADPTWILSCRFSTDGSQIVASGHAVNVWRTKSMGVPFEPKAIILRSMRFSGPDQAKSLEFAD